MASTRAVERGAIPADGEARLNLFGGRGRFRFCLGLAHGGGFLWEDGAPARARVSGWAQHGGMRTAISARRGAALGVPNASTRECQHRGTRRKAAAGATGVGTHPLPALQVVGAEVGRWLGRLDLGRQGLLARGCNALSAHRGLLTFLVPKEHSR